LEAGVESHTRSVVKSLSYRVFGSLGTSAVAWVLTRKLSISLAVGALDTVVKLCLYYLHERAWSHIPYGRIAKIKSEG